ncbi:MAG: DUF2974 domain-containing protein [Firmicutes bacterium]|nr:DUF2974 domain-containing protein [Bacillota bacterium]
MANIYDYIKWRGDLSFGESEFNEVDGAVLSQFAYAPFEKMSYRYPISLNEAAARLSKLKNLEDAVLFRGDAKLIYSLIDSRRFADMEITSFVNRSDEERQTQFCALTYKFARGIYLITFRGTDDTLIGWKEDFNMSFTFPVGAQIEAVSYFENIAKKHPSAKYILCGHSKGGNLAVYAAAFCKARYQNKIIKVYNYDGPGFGEGMLESEGYKRIKDRTETFVPQSSIVGMVLEHEEDYTVIHSSAAENGILQHEMYSWETESRAFAHLGGVTKKSQIIDKTLKAWIADMDFKRREEFVDALFSVLSETNAKTITDLNKNGFKNTAGILKAVNHLDNKTKTMLFEVLSKLVKAAAENIMQK